MSIAEQHNVPAAWYPDQTNPSQLRWWDGSDWTSDVRPLAAPVAVAAPGETPLLETRRGLHAVAKPAQGFGHATPEQLRSWPAPQPEHRNEVPAPVTEMPREWATNSSVDAIKGWMAKSAEPVQFVPSLASNDPAPAEIEDLTYSGVLQPADYFSEAPVVDPVEDNSGQGSVAALFQSTVTPDSISFSAAVPVTPALGFPAPAFEAPRYEAPAPAVADDAPFERTLPPVYQTAPAPAFESAAFEVPAYSAPAYEAPAFEAPVFESAAVVADEPFEEVSKTLSYVDWQPAVPGWDVAAPAAAEPESAFPAVFAAPLPAAPVAAPERASLAGFDEIIGTTAPRPLAPSNNELAGLAAVAPVVSHQVPQQAAVALTRRQLRELVGGPLTTGVEAE